MGSIISDIATLRKTVKVTANMPYEVVEPFLRSARDLFLVRYLGRELVEVLEMESVPDRATELRGLAQMALGPLAVWIGGSELSVRIGDSGMTVENTDKLVAASDKKIESVTESVERRGFQYLDMVLEYLEENKDQFPEWTESRYFTLRAGNYIRSVVQFQELGKVDIDYSRLTFEKLRPLMSNIEERFITNWVGEELDATLRSVLDSEQTDAQKRLIAAIRNFVACKTAELYTSEASRQNRTGSDTKEYKPIIRPAYTDTSSTGNFYADQAEYYQEKVQQIMIKFASELGITPAEDIEFNSDEQRLFFAG